MKYINKNLQSIFYIILFINVILFYLPVHYTFGVYTPNFIGWFWMLGLIPISIIMFFRLLIVNSRNGETKKSVVMTIIVLVIFLTSIAYWIYQAKKLGNI
jgi:hypothetical protein